MNPREIRVLSIIEDPLVREVLRRVLREAGYQLIQAGDGESGLEAIGWVRPQIVLLDPELRGDPSPGQIVERVSARHPASVVVLLTGRRGHSAARRLLELGAWGQVLEPFTSDELLRTLRQSLRGSSCHGKVSPNNGGSS